MLYYISSCRLEQSLEPSWKISLTLDDNFGYYGYYYKPDKYYNKYKLNHYYKFTPDILYVF